MYKRLPFLLVRVYTCAAGRPIIIQNHSKGMSFFFYINEMMPTLSNIEQLYPYYPQIVSYPKQDEATHFTFIWNPSPIETSFVISPPKLEEIPNTSSSTIRKPKTLRSEAQEVLSARKNSESNIINQFYSYFSSRQKSEKIVLKCASLLGKEAPEFDQLLCLFYSSVRYINARRGRKYMNVSQFFKFFTPEELGEYLGDLRYKIDESQCLNLWELSEMFRRCAHFFLREISAPAILTSKRISILSKHEHLRRRTKILRTLLEH